MKNRFASLPVLSAVSAALILICSISASSAGERTLDVRQFGATGNGVQEDTAAIQKAIDASAKRGGGVVRFSPGKYLSRPIVLRDNCELVLEKGATLLATDERSHFLKPDAANPPATGDFFPFVGGKGLTNVAITGGGIIDGSGARWWGPAREAKLTNKTNSGYTLPRPRLILLSKCRNVRITGITLANSPTFHFVPEECEDVLVENVTIIAPDEGVNTDGIDPSRSRRVRISKCRIDVGDDNIAIKSGKAVPGREFACEDILITDCIFLRGHGMSIGSETVGGVRNVRVERCIFNGTENGIRIKSPRGRGGRVEDIIYSDISMTNVHPAIVITCYYPKIPAQDNMQPSTPETPAFKNIVISNLVAQSTEDAGVIVGLPESPISGVRLTRVKINAGGGGLTIRNAKGVTLEEVDVIAASGAGILKDNAEVVSSAR